MVCIVSPTNSYVETLIPIVTVFGDRAYKQESKIKWSLKDGVLIW